MDSSPVSSSSRPRRWLRKVSRIALLVYLGLCAAMYMLQDWMIFPGRSAQGTAVAEVRPVAGQELLHLPTAKGETIAMLYGAAQLPDGSAAPDASSRPTILYFFGNAMSLSGCLEEFSHFRRLGCNVAVAEFVGYGLSTGKASEAAIYRTADTAYDALVARRDVDARQIIPVGWSLGATAAIHLASTRKVAGLATFSAFTSMHDMGRQILPWLPTSLLEKYRFDNLAKMPLVKCPAFLAHGTIDDLVPFSMNARLAAACGTSAQAVAVSGADHNYIFQVGGKDLMMNLGSFIEGIHRSVEKKQ
jgi:fermentation-respiration switch protein FrsA (DUF1100 family)